MPEPKILRLVLGDQLNGQHDWFQKPDKQVSYALMEVRQETDYAPHHIQKVAAFFKAMRGFARHLRQQGHRVIYLKLNEENNAQNLAANIQTLVKQHGFTRFEYMLPDEYRLDIQLKKMVKKLPVPSQAVDSQHFLTARDELKEFFVGKKRYLMESFYRWMRKRHGILMDGAKPVGGKWNYDQSNRQAYDPNVQIPPALLFENDVGDIVETIQKHGVKTIGEIQPSRLIWPVNREQSLDVLNHFVQHLLHQFGTYQDAMTLFNWHLFHSRLSFSLNAKMLHPLEVIEAALAAWEERPQQIAIQQIEGFVRQILGWREYMRGIYWSQMPAMAEMNHFSHKATLPAFYWTGETRMSCLAAAIGQSLEQAYAHHIQRLMITGNFALLAGVSPAEVDEWYLGIYIDAIEWVELPNTRAMSQFADGGLVATKPYVSSARYIKRMSDYCEDCVYQWKLRHGKGACPYNSLYWDFYERHRDLLASNARVGMVYRTWDRMDPGEKRQVLKQAAIYKKALDSL